MSALLKGRALPLLAVLCLLTPALPAGADTPTNSIRSIQTVVTNVPVPAVPTTGRASRARVQTPKIVTYNVTLSSTAPFPMTDAVVTLSIGGKEFINSTYAPGGTLNSLVFSLTAAQFQSLKSGAPVVVYYGQDNAALPAAQWSFGTLDLSLLDRPATAPRLAAPRSAAPVVARGVIQKKGL